MGDFPTVRTFYGVDFSGAKAAGRNIWIASLEASGPDGVRLRLGSLGSLERLAGTAERGAALRHLVELIASSESALWALDFPFGLPLELMGGGWETQLRFLEEWSGDGYEAGLRFLADARALGGPGHLRRHTDVEERAPFDPYHYRIIYQTFHGMRDVLGPLRRLRGTAVLPFHYRRLPSARRVLVEACPSSTLRRLGLPYHRYKQPGGGPLTRVRLLTRRAIVDALSEELEISRSQRLVMMRNPGGDALDAVIAAAGGAWSWHNTDHAAVAKHPRYRFEGRMYV